MTVLRKILLLVPAAVMLPVTSCINRLNLPDQITYSVDVSYDALELFQLKAVYKDQTGLTEEVPLSSTHWVTNIQKKDGFKGELAVKMYAKDQSGANLVKDAYNMSVRPEIRYGGITAALSDGNGTKAAKADPASDTRNVKFKFRVPCSQPVKVSAAPLKYNKHMVFCYTIDDASVNAWSRVFAVINGKWVDDREFFHKGLKKSTGYWQKFALCFTDGCGNDRRFTFGNSIWATLTGPENPDGFVLDVSKSYYNPYVSWEELQVMTDMGNSVNWHNVPTAVDDSLEKNVAALVEGLETDFDRTMVKIGYPMKVLAQPDGNEAYLEAAALSPYVRLTRATSGEGHMEEVYLLDTVSIDKREVFGGYTEGNYEDKLHELSVQALSDKPTLVGKLDHRPQKDAIDFLYDIFDLYGSHGADNIWVTTYDELFEYKEMISSLELATYENDGYTEVEVSVPIDETFIFNDLSFTVEGADGPAEPVSKNLYGFSSAVQKDGTVLVNCTFTDRIYELADKYVTLYEEEFDEEDGNYAEYLVSLLREDLRAPFIARIQSTTGPSKGKMPVNGKYTREQMNKYLLLYDQYECKIEYQF